MIVVLLVAVRYLLMERDSSLFDVMEKKKQLTDKDELLVKRSQSCTEPSKRSLDEIKADMKDKVQDIIKSRTFQWVNVRSLLKIL